MKKSILILGTSLALGAGVTLMNSSFIYAETDLSTANVTYTSNGDTP